MKTICSRARLHRALTLLVAFGLISTNLWQPVRATLSVQGSSVAAGNVPTGLSASEWQRMLAQIEQDHEQTDPVTGESWVVDEVKKLTASDAQADDEFGYSVALDGDTALIGARFEDGGPGDPIYGAGAVYVFKRNAGGDDTWEQVKKLTASDAAEADQFGYSVALYRDTALVGAITVDGEPNVLRDIGAVYVFERNAGGVNNWAEVKKLTASDAWLDEWFGSSVALYGNTALVGALWKDGPGQFDLDSGAAYVFERNAGGANNWGEVKKLTASDIQAVDYFGGSVALYGDTALVGAYGEDGGPGSPLDDAGAVYVFERNAGGNGNWGEVKKLTASDAQADDEFGSSVALYEDTALVGAELEDGGPGDPVFQAGAVYVFERNAGGGNNWGEVKKLTASDAQPQDRFGSSVALDGNAAVVGASQEDGGPGDPQLQAGAAYVFERNAGGAGNWGEVKKLTASDAQAQDWFGSSVALGGDAVVAGVGNPVPSAGAAYVYRLTFIASDLAVTKTVAPALATPGQPVTYTLTFSNTGSSVASNVVISDSLPLSLTVTGVASQTLGAGVVITQTSGPPDLAWSVSALALGEGGTITLTALLDDAPELLGITLTNTVAITDTDDLTPSNNTASADLAIPPAEHVFLPLILRQE